MHQTARVARPRDPDLDRRILDSFRALADRDGIHAVTISAIAEHSGVSRPAIYRRWPNLDALAFSSQATLGVEAFPDLGSLRAELIEAVHRLTNTLDTTDRNLAGAMVSRMISDPDFAAAIQQDRWGPDAARLSIIWQRAIERNEVDPDTDGVEVIEDLLAKAFYEVGVLHHTFAGEQVERFVDRILVGVLRRN